MNIWLSIVVGLWGILVLFVFWARTRLQYHITQQHLEIRWCGLLARKLLLADIDYISKYQHSRAEHWENTWRPAHKRLVLHRRHGFLTDVVITPPYRYEFRRELEEAMAASTSTRPDLTLSHTTIL